MKLLASTLLCFFIGISSFAQTEVGEWKIDKSVLKTENSLANKYWNKVTIILPPQLITKYVTSFRLYTDGKDNELAAITPVNYLNTQWRIEIDTADMNLNNLDSAYVLQYTHTLIHEFGHVLTLNASQIEPTKDEYPDLKKGYFTDEGYAHKNSYLNLFVNRFWNSSLLEEWRNINSIRNENKRVDEFYEFYLTDTNRYVTSYAAEAPEEDICESWTFFVLSDKPTKSNIRAKKVLFFYQFPELVEYRNYIRSKINTPKNYFIHRLEPKPIYEDEWFYYKY